MELSLRGECWRRFGTCPRRILAISKPSGRLSPSERLRSTLRREDLSPITCAKANCDGHHARARALAPMLEATCRPTVGGQRRSLTLRWTEGAERLQRLRFQR